MEGVYVQLCSFLTMASPETETPVPEWEIECTPELVWKFWQRACPCWQLNHGLYSPYPSHYTDYTTPALKKAVLLVKSHLAHHFQFAH